MTVLLQCECFFEENECYTDFQRYEELIRLPPEYPRTTSPLRKPESYEKI